MNAASPSSPPAPVTFALGAALAGLAALSLAHTLVLWPHWRMNADLSHGFFMPFVFLFLLYESRKATPRYLAAGPRPTALTAALLVFGLLTLTASGLYAAAVGWSHSLVAFTLTLSLASLLGAGLVVLSLREVRLLPLNWTSVTAIALWLLCAPIPPGSYSRLTLGLQLMVTNGVLHTLHLLGIAATRQGNIIDLATTSVGVEEACSGVRSLISCVFAGVLFSATLVRRPWARAALILLAVPLALVMNFLRSLTLTLLANRGIAITGTWHDFTGFAVLGVTAALLGGLALLLETSPAAAAPPALPTPPARRSRLPHMLLGGLVTVAALAFFFHSNTRPSINANAPVPDLSAILPAKADGWEVQDTGDIYQFSSTLQTDHLLQRTYSRPTPAGPEFFTVYLAYWRAGQAPVSFVASHTPDACWPGSGWEPAPLPRTREQLALAGRVLPVAEAREFRGGPLVQRVWFWHLYDGRPIDFRDPYSPSALLSIAWRYGFRRDGDQLFVRVSSNRPWGNFAHAPLVTEIFSRLQTLGL